MALTVSQALFHASHSIGGAGEQSEVGGLAVLNYAGTYLCSSRAWRWLERQQVKLDLVKDQDYVWLPRGLLELVGYDMTQGLTTGLSVTTHQHLIQLRTSAITTSTWRYWAALTHASQESAATSALTCALPDDGHYLSLSDGYNPTVSFYFEDTAGSIAETATTREVPRGASATPTTIASDLAEAINNAPLLHFSAEVDATTATVINLTHMIPGARGNLGAEAAWVGDPEGHFVATNLEDGVDPGTPRPRLDIWPTPAATELDAITLYYRGGWSPIDEDTTLLPIPEWFEPLYIETVRQVSRGFEMEDDAPMGDRMAALFTGPLYLAARRVDDGMAPDYGPLRGGAVEQQMGIRATNHWNFNSVSAPS